MTTEDLRRGASHGSALATDLLDPGARAYLTAAIEEAQSGMDAGGIPIGSVMEIDGRIVGRGHNRRVQDSSPVMHAEMHCLEQAGRLRPRDYARATLYTTLSPCDMCCGAILLYGIPRVVVGENSSFMGQEDHLRARGVEVVVVDDARCREMFTQWRLRNPELWDEDVGGEQ